MSSDADLDALDDTPEPETAGERMYAAISKFVSAIYDDTPTLVTRFVVAAEADDGEARWVEVAAFSADGHSLAQWESLGLIEYAKRIERGDFARSASDEDLDDE